MLLKDLILEEQILSAPMMEMANMPPSNTGLGYVIWLGKVGGQHGPRIKVSNTKGRFNEQSNFVISVSREPQVLTPSSRKIKMSELEDILDWVKLNYDLLMKLWQIYETGEGDAFAILNDLQKI